MIGYANQFLFFWKDRVIDKNRTYLLYDSPQFIIN